MQYNDANTTDVVKCSSSSECLPSKLDLKLNEIRVEKAAAGPGSKFETGTDKTSTDRTEADGTETNGITTDGTGTHGTRNRRDWIDGTGTDLMRTGRERWEWGRFVIAMFFCDLTF